MSGGLFELVARGKKDVFFTANPVMSYFHSVFVKAAAFTKEIYITAPRNAPEWGHWVDFDLDHRGDIARAFYLHVQLPTWLPQPAVEANPTGIVTDASGVTFGYCNNIGFQIINKVQVFQDQVLLHELYGEYLDWKLRQSYEYSTTFLMSTEVGSRPETALAIGRTASPPLLRVPIPLIGWQHLFDPGFPMIAMRKQRFRIRVYLRDLRELIVASDGRLKPSPWGGKPLLIQRTQGGPVDTTQVTLPYPAMKQIVMNLESTQLYVPPDVQTWLKSRVIRFPFIHTQFQQFTLEDNTMAAASVSVALQVPLAVDMIGSMSRLTIGVRSEAAGQAGQRSKLTTTEDGSYVQTLRLNIANIDRIKAWPVAFFREGVSYWKNVRMPQDLYDSSKPFEIYSMTFGGFDDDGRPAGTLNFTRAIEPTLFTVLANTPMDNRNYSRRAYVLVYGESWNVWEISGGVGKMMFDDS
jgi:hypothetical protein